MKRPRGILFTKKKMFAISLTLTGMLAGFYIYQVNMMTTLAYQIAQEEQEIAELTAETRELTAQQAQSLSFSDFNAIASEFHFEKIEQVSYVKIPSSTVAQNQGSN